jgi:chromosome partitioning protein
MGAVVAIVNQKGGVGKTTVALALASSALAFGDRVLMVDADPQASCTWALGVDPESVERGTSWAIGKDLEGAARKAIVLSDWDESIGVLAGSGSLTQREADQKPTHARRLAKALLGVTDEYELTIIDCSPAIGALTTCALAAADLALIVVEPAAFSLRGINGVSDLIDEVWADHNQRLDLAGVITNRVVATSGEARRQQDALLTLLGASTLWKPEIPQRTVLAEAAALRRPIHSLGARARDVTNTFDQHYKTLRTMGRKAMKSR